MIDVDVLRAEARVGVDRARREVARALRWAAERLREDEPIASGAVVADAVAVVPPTPAPRVAAAPEPAPVAAPAPEPAPVAATAPEPVAAPEPAAPDTAALREQVVEVLHTVFDPEIPVDIYELGLIYTVDVDAAGHARIRMTLTSPNCPAAASLPSEVELKVGALDGIDSVEVDVVFEPPWTPDLMSEEARLQLNLA